MQLSNRVECESPAYWCLTNLRCFALNHRLVIEIPSKIIMNGWEIPVEETTRKLRQHLLTKKRRARDLSAREDVRLWLTFVCRSCSSAIAGEIINNKPNKRDVPIWVNCSRARRNIIYRFRCVFALIRIVINLAFLKCLMSTRLEYS